MCLLMFQKAVASELQQKKQIALSELEDLVGRVSRDKPQDIRAILLRSQLCLALLLLPGLLAGVPRAILLMLLLVLLRTG